MGISSYGEEEVMEVRDREGEEEGKGFGESGGF